MKYIVFITKNNRFHYLLSNLIEDGKEEIADMWQADMHKRYNCWMQYLRVNVPENELDLDENMSNRLYRIEVVIELDESDIEKYFSNDESQDFVYKRIILEEGDRNVDWSYVLEKYFCKLDIRCIR